MTLETADGSPGDRLAVLDALLRFAAGADAGDEDLITSAFTPDAEVDFGPCGRSLGLDFAVLRSRAAIVGFLACTAEWQVTSHAVTNPLAAIAGDRARLRTLVDAVHIVRDEPGTRFRMMNRYEAELDRGADGWAIDRLRINNVWFEGDPRTLLLRRGARHAP